MIRKLIIMTIVLSLFSCTKDNKDIPKNTGCLISSIRFDFEGDNQSKSNGLHEVTNFEYNSKGLITLVKVSTQATGNQSGSWGDEIFGDRFSTFGGYIYSYPLTKNGIERFEYKFDYQKEKIVIETYNDRQVMERQTTYYLDNGKIAYFYNSSGNKVEYEYNSNNTLSKIITYDKSSAQSYTKSIKYDSDDSFNVDENIKFEYSKTESSIEFVSLYLPGFFLNGIDKIVLYEQGYFGNKINNRISSYSYLYNNGLENKTYSDNINYVINKEETSINYQPATSINLKYKCE